MVKRLTWLGFPDHIKVVNNIFYILNETIKWPRKHKKLVNKLRQAKRFDIGNFNNWAQDSYRTTSKDSF